MEQIYLGFHLPERTFRIHEKKEPTDQISMVLQTFLAIATIYNALTFRMKSENDIGKISIRSPQISSNEFSLHSLTNIQDNSIFSNPSRSFTN